MKRVSLQTKILGLVLTLSLFLVFLLTAYFTYMEARQIIEDRGLLALNLSKTISFMPSIIEAFESEDPPKIIQPIAERIRMETGAEFVVVGNRDRIRYSHPVESQIGKQMVGGDSERVFQEGEYYISKAQGSLGLSIRGKAPIFNENSQIIGIVSVGFLVEDVRELVVKNISKELYISVIAVIISILCSYFLAKSIRKDIYGLEPFQIANLYKEKRAVLHAVKEGILSTDHHGIITSMNQQAKELLDIKGSARNIKVEEFLPADYIYRVLQSGDPEIDKEIQWKDKMIIVSCTPIFGDKGVSGAVASFRDKTEIVQMMNTLSEMKEYSEGLRAQTHEYANNLYVLSGLLQLGEYDEALTMIQSETAELKEQNRIVFEQIEDIKVQAILLGKLGKASEKKIKFEIDAESYIGKLPEHIQMSQITIILSNLIDNAFEAVYGSDEPIVKLFATDLGDDIIFEISDNGKGITDQEVQKLFERGFTSKSGELPRGYGLQNVERAVKELKGIIEVTNGTKYTVFAVYLPKEL
ncbi:sensor histidine kinase [Oceanobacillus piezotolerans]|uniref:histidine kinase n=1 Tax=Oceanobacillus piezotolerans TaxID=2448030 RepID=A0A498DAD4_9BACI|nr:sensor histidine kinase [Oceanobacillus piezotolerans]RLL43890.1 sensor histidine kinase [Oceanobacillus piezotolerans]